MFLAKKITLAGALLLMGCGQFEPDMDFIDRYLPVVMHPPKVADEKSQHVPASYIVMFRSEEQRPALSFSSFNQEVMTIGLPLMDRHAPDTRIKSIQVITSIDLNQAKHSKTSVNNPESLNLVGGENFSESRMGVMAQVDFFDREGAEQTLAEWEKEGRIWFADPNWKSTLSVQEAGETENTDPDSEDNSNLTMLDQLSNDYEQRVEHWISSMNLDSAYANLAAAIRGYNENFGGTEAEYIAANAPVIAVMDSGVDYEHPALKHAIWENTAPGRSECGNDLHGCDTSQRTFNTLGKGATVLPFSLSEPNTKCQTKPNEGATEIQKKTFTNCRHGTHVAGIVAGNPNSTLNPVAGVCPFCKVMIVKVVGGQLTSGGGIEDGSILNGFKYLWNFVNERGNVVRVVNTSIGKFQRSRSVALMVHQLYNHGKGILVIGAAGNLDSAARNYPAAIGVALAVSSVADNGEKASYSNYGSWVDVAAPGGQQRTKGAAENDGGINSAIPGAEVGAEQGTSMAAPMVSGLAGLILTQNPEITASQLRTLIISSTNSSIYTPEVAPTNAKYYVRQIGDSYVPLLGSGRVDALAALTGQGSPLSTIEYNGRVQPGCGVVGQSSSFGLLALAMPFFFVLIRRKED